MITNKEVMMTLTTTVSTQIGGVKIIKDGISHYKVFDEGKSLVHETYDSFRYNCDSTKVTDSEDCTKHKLYGYWCCQVMDPEKNKFCSTYSDIVAKTKTSTNDHYFSYVCKADYVGYKLINIGLLLFAFLLTI